MIAVSGAAFARAQPTGKVVGTVVRFSAGSAPSM